MTAALYALSAVIAAVLATRAWLQDRDHPARTAFMGMGWTLAVAYLSFALSFLPGLVGLRALYGMSGVLALSFAWRCVDVLFARNTGPDVLGERLPWLIGSVAGVMSLWQATRYAGSLQSSPPEWVVGAMAAGLALMVLRRLQVAMATADLTVERRRLGLIHTTTVLTAAFAVAEWVARTVGPVTDDAVAFFDRGMIYQGALPPVSALFAAGSTYLLYHTIVAQRLVALQELLARIMVVTASAALLVAAHTLTLRFVELTRFPLHSSLLLLLTSSLFLSFYGTLKQPFDRITHRWFNAQRQELDDAVAVLLRTLPAQTEPGPVAAALVDRLYGVGRFGGVSAWLYDGPLDAWRLAGSRGTTGVTPLEVVARPFVDGFLRGDRAYVRDDGTALVTRLMDGMGADLVMPIRSGDVVYGWVALRDEVWSDGFTEAERGRIEQVTSMAALVLSNLASFRRLEEEHRLAAVGTMAAGLAHEIRNPLAGLKGAAQVLQDEQLSEDAGQMLQIIIDEVNRLDRVVSRFLDFARPFALQRSRGDLNAVVRHALGVVRAQGLPDDLQLVEDLSPGLPELPLDAERLIQVVLNLVHNAMQAIDGDGRIVVRTRARVGQGESQAVELSVSDDGPGIDEATQAQLFTPFFTTKAQGTGLGLAICRRIVVAHGGEMQVVSAPDEGATFVIRLPVVR